MGTETRTTQKRNFFDGKKSNAFVVMFLEQEQEMERRRQLQVLMDSRKDRHQHSTASKVYVTVFFRPLEGSLTCQSCEGF